jgi:ribosomal protein L12E/L44/L45/RPP1/RPP2
MFAKALKGQNIEDLLTSISAAPVGAPAAAAPVTAAPAKAGIFLLSH